MEHIKIFNHVPIPASRPRIAKRRAYYNEPYNSYKAIFKEWARQNYKEQYQGAIGLNIYFYMPIPKSLSKKKQDELAEQWHVKRPDADNLIKGVKDALNGYAFKDDSQVCQLFTTKKYSHSPRIEISIKEL